jgi:hypothetical protein
MGMQYEAAEASGRVSREIDGEELMTEIVKPNKGGRPKLSPPQNADECRRLIAQECCRSNSKPREIVLRGLYRLLTAYERNERDASGIELRRVALEEETARQKRDEITLKKQDQLLRSAEYRRRFATMPHGQQKLLKSLERLEKENVDLKKQIAELMAELGRAA